MWDGKTFQDVGPQRRMSLLIEAAVLLHDHAMSQAVLSALWSSLCPVLTMLVLLRSCAVQVPARLL